ncbi:transcriptional regulator, TetR family [Sphingomonas gellani]|uniref:Transcriptional regulator, TetR family n=1 Tax=Sphingomonas gellani TaxID=1166340 RepID=A0A1H8J4S9_9SPHN|nr:TetR family transcriptional regulator [Sphingomonas gellani]SEN75659.1 transcriptional regulator, TetR family [Sphingomonas gellani]
MALSTKRTDRRTEALSKERIVEAAIHILDAEGERALTFRALATRLATGSGAIYWHVADKQALLAAATDHILASVMAEVAERSTLNHDAIRTVALGMFDAIEAHPWIGAQLSGDPWQQGLLRILEGIGRQVQALGVPESALFNATTALLNCILGVAAQHAAAERLPRGTERSVYLAAIAERWTQLDLAEYPFVHHLAAQLPGHDDREQFLAGVNLVLAGIESIR